MGHNGTYRPAAKKTQCDRWSPRESQLLSIRQSGQVPVHFRVRFHLYEYAVTRWDERPVSAGCDTLPMFDVLKVPAIGTRQKDS